MTASKPDLRPGAVDFDAELEVLADSAVSYQRHDEAVGAGTGAAELVSRAFARAAVIADTAEARARVENAVACRKGCAWCCHQNVRVSAAEVFHLANWLRAQLSTVQFEALKTHVQQTASRLRGMPQPERARARIACSLLDSQTGACRVHAARPMLCRGQLSVSAQVCQRAVEAPGQHAFEPLLAGLHAAGLASMSLELEFAFFGSGPVSGELTAMLAVALSDPGAETRWSQGENPFPRHNEFSTHLNSRMARMLGSAWARLASAHRASEVDKADIRAAAMKFLRQATGADEPLH